ncbi:ArsR family transcriptional regulator [Cohnella endophytica]|uniref:ArsR family transcriptional regulator n=1 Tax=Cohnella endophytica TaxID=2419778 RepID=A0A494XZU0_9BACL|nr:helix-turn-helix domain-containing protein [Cohnella endophytica]RKP53063.1 ArsR family transcriptional regulator [Cohnella endophytica]
MNGLPDNVKKIAKMNVQETAKALSGDLRLRIVEALGEREMSISQLAEQLGVAQPTVTINVQMLESVGLVESRQGINREKICFRTYDTVVLDLPKKPGEGLHGIEDIQMGIGMYSSCDVDSPCGLLGPEDMIGCPDDPRAFYDPQRGSTELLWFGGSGYVEYYFPNPVPPGVRLKELRLSAEVCSEAPGYEMEWPSDIAVWINGHLIGEWTSPSDFGDRKGVLTPSRWLGMTQYGKLTEWAVGENGSRVNERKGASVKLADLGLHFSKPIVVRLGVREDAENKRGLNLFGERFGDYSQGLKLSFVHQD